KLKQLRTTEDTILQYEKTPRESVPRELQRMRESILTEIRTVLNAKAQSGGFNLVIDTAAETVNGTPVVMYSNTGKDDLTDAVLSQLNAAAPASALKPEDTKTDKK